MNDSGLPKQPLNLKNISKPRQKRIWEAMELWDSGMTQEEIAERLGVSVRQIRYDLKDGMELLGILSQVNQEQFINWAIRFLQREIRQANRSAQLFKQENSKLGAKRLAGDFLSKLISFMQDTGLLVKVPQRISLEDFNPFEDPEFYQEYMDLMKRAREKGICKERT